MQVLDLVAQKDFKELIIKCPDITKVNLNRFQVKDSNSNIFKLPTPLSSEVPMEVQQVQLGFPPRMEEA